MVRLGALTTFLNVGRRETTSLSWNATWAQVFLIKARSLKNKLPHLHLFLGTYQPDLVFVTESWLNSNVGDSEILSGYPYRIFRLDRYGRKGGGVCCIAKREIDMVVFDTHSCLKSDLLCLVFSDMHSNVTCKLAIVYRPPNFAASDDDSLIECLTDYCSSFEHLIALGDFNIDVDWVHSSPKNSVALKFFDFFKNCGLQQLVTENTRGNSVLDLILTSTPSIKNVQILPPLGASDHNVVSFELDVYVFSNIRGPLHYLCDLASPSLLLSRSSFQLPRPDFNRINYFALNSYFSKIDWLSVFNGYTSVDDVYYRFVV